MRTASWWKVGAAAAALVLMAACSGGGDGGGGGGGGGGSTTACGTTTQGCISGNVVDSAKVLASNPNPEVPSASISIAGGAPITANAQGYFFTNAVGQGQNISICFSATGYVTRCRNVTVVGGQTLMMTPTGLMTSSESKSLSTGGGSIDNLGNLADPTAAKLMIVAGDLCDAAGNAAAGNVNCTLTPMDVSATGGANTRDLAPGNFRGTDLASATQMLESGGMMDIVCTDAAGARVNVCTGKTVTVQVPIYANCAAQPATMPSWSFNQTTGVWEQGPTAWDFTKTCGPLGTSADSYYTGMVNHFSYWNCDQVMETTCLKGKVMTQADPNASPPIVATAVAGALVKCSGTDYQGDSETYTGSDGTFCAPVKRAGTVSCVAMKGQFVAVSKPVTADNNTLQCSDAACKDIGTFDVIDPLMQTTLRWGEFPHDLDSHFVGTGVHVWYSDKDILTKGLLTGAPFVGLDTDDTDSYGPEITTVVPGVTQGIYTFCVHNFSGEADGPIASSSAKVNVVTAGGYNNSFSVPVANPSGFNVWRVYSVNIAVGSDGVYTETVTEINDFVDDSASDVTTVCVPAGSSAAPTPSS
jgi:hypothetical protein